MGGAFTVKGMKRNLLKRILLLILMLHMSFSTGITRSCASVPLDVTRKVTWTFDQVQAVPETNAINIWLKNFLSHGLRTHTHERKAILFA